MSALRTEYVDVEVGEGAMPIYTAVPPNATNRPGLMVFMEAFGVNDHIRDVARRYARRGYVVASPDLYHRSSPGFEGSYTDLDPVLEQREKITTANLINDIQSCYDWLGTDERTDEKRIGSVGYCMGGQTSYLANTAVPLQASVCYYGGGISELVDRAENLHAPILFIWGGQDDYITPDNRRTVIEAVQDKKQPHTQVVFSEAEHGFACDARDSYHPDATRQALALTKEFFRTHLT